MWRLECAPLATPPAVCRGQEQESSGVHAQAGGTPVPAHPPLSAPPVWAQYPISGPPPRRTKSVPPRRRTAPRCAQGVRRALSVMQSAHASRGRQPRHPTVLRKLHWRRCHPRRSTFRCAPLLPLTCRPCRRPRNSSITSVAYCPLIVRLPRTAGMATHGHLRWLNFTTPHLSRWNRLVGDPLAPGRTNRGSPLSSTCLHYWPGMSRWRRLSWGPWIS